MRIGNINKQKRREVVGVNQDDSKRRAQKKHVQKYRPVIKGFEASTNRKCRTALKLCGENLWRKT